MMMWMFVPKQPTDCIFKQSSHIPSELIDGHVIVSVQASLNHVQPDCAIDFVVVTRTPTLVNSTTIMFLG